MLPVVATLHESFHAAISPPLSIDRRAFHTTGRHHHHSSHRSKRPPRAIAQSTPLSDRRRAGMFVQLEPFVPYQVTCTSVSGSGHLSRTKSPVPLSQLWTET